MSFNLETPFRALLLTDWLMASSFLFFRTRLGLAADLVSWLAHLVLVRLWDLLCFFTYLARRFT